MKKKDSAITFIILTFPHTWAKRLCSGRKIEFLFFLNDCISIFVFTKNSLPKKKEKYFMIHFFKPEYIRFFYSSNATEWVEFLSEISFLKYANWYSHYNTRWGNAFTRKKKLNWMKRIKKNSFWATDNMKISIFALWNAISVSDLDSDSNSNSTNNKFEVHKVIQNKCTIVQNNNVFVESFNLLW